MVESSIIEGYHAHIYYDEQSYPQAQALIASIEQRFMVDTGRMHRRPVGPHPMWSCQLTVLPDQFATLLPWLALNRDGLIVFIHPLTDDPLADHRDRVIWLGESQPLDLTILGG